MVVCKIIKLSLLINFLLCTLSYSQLIDIVDGTKIIKNISFEIKHVNDNKNLEFVRIIGDLNSNDKNLMFYLPSDILIDNYENIYVLDIGNYRVQKYNKDLNFLLTFGGKGQGPDEFQLMDQLGLTNNSEIIVSDGMTNKFSIFTQKGQWINSFSIKNNPGSKFRLTKNDFIIPYRRTMLDPIVGDAIRNGKEQLVEIYKDNKKLSGFGDKLIVDNQIANVLLNLYQMDLDKEDNIYVAFRYLNRIEKYSLMGNLIFRIERPLHFKVTDFNKQYYDNTPKGIKHLFSTLRTTTVDIAVDNNQRMWVITPNRFIREDEKTNQDLSGFYGAQPNPVKKVKKNKNIALDRTDMYDIELFSSEGILVSKIRLNHFANSIRIYGNKLFIIDKFHNMQIYEYKIKFN